MTFEGYLRIDFFLSFFIVFPGKSFYNKIEVILHRSFLGNNLFFPEFSNRYIRVDKLSKLIFSDINKFLNVIQKRSCCIHTNLLLWRKLLKIDFNQSQNMPGKKIKVTKAFAAHSQ